MKPLSYKIAITATLLALIFIANLSLFEQKSRSYIDNSFQRALATFALAKTLNGVISVIQGTEIAATPAGVGVKYLQRINQNFDIKQKV